mmetsp:Transcript_18394/g.22948  ORF Transcript_18394/g.22948 Transcript_18394/m.22948 type:complete len:214 (-) Transcript_18394:77-718(-)
MDPPASSRMLSPGFSSIVTSARREASNGLNFEIGDLNAHALTMPRQTGNIFSPSRKRNSHALLYGRSQMSRVKLQIESRVQQAEFCDKVLLQQNAVNLIKKAARIGVATLDHNSLASDTFGEARSFGGLSNLHTQTKLKSIIKIKTNVNREGDLMQNTKTSLELNQEDVKPMMLGKKQTTKILGLIVGRSNMQSIDHFSSIPRTADSPTRMGK